MTEENILERIQAVVDILDDIDMYLDSLNDKLSYYDQLLSDYRHFLKDNEFTPEQAYKVALKVKEIGKQREIIKQDLVLRDKFRNNINKLLTLNNRSFLMVELNKVSKFFNQPYKYRVLEESELEDLTYKLPQRLRVRGRKIGDRIARRNDSCIDRATDKREL